jgi:ribonuclease J
LSGKLRVLPLGGLGEIGKNMTVLEYEDSIVIVDTGLRFPTAEMPGVDLVLPDFNYLRERGDDIEAIVITHAHEDHVGALPWVLREVWGRGAEDAAPVYGRKLTMAMARSRLDEHKLRDVDLQDVECGEKIEAGPFTLELIHMTHSIPHAAGVAVTCDLGTVLVTGDYKFDQTPVSSSPPDFGRLARLGEEGVLLLCGDSTNADRPGWSPSEAGVGPHLQEVIERAPGRVIVTSFASNVHRVQQVIDAAVALDRKVALVGRSMKKYQNIARSLGLANVPDGVMIGNREMDDFPDEKVVVMSTGVAGRARLGAAAYGPQRPSRGAAARRRHRRLQRDADPRQRARDQRDGRPALPHRLPRRDGPGRADPRQRPRLRRGDQAHARADQAQVRHAVPRRPQAAAHPRRAGGGLRRRGGQRLLRRERPAARDRRQGRAVRRARAVRRDLRRRAQRRRGQRRRPARPADAVGRRHLRRRHDDLRADRPVRRRPRGHPARVPFPDEANQLLDQLRDAVDQSLKRAAKEEIREVDMLEKVLHDDLGAFVYDRLKRRPMVLPVVVEV